MADEREVAERRKSRALACADKESGFHIIVD